MKNLFKTPFLIAFLATSLVFTSCGDETTEGLDDDGVIDDGTDGGTDGDATTYDLTVNTTNAAETAERNLEIETTPGEPVTVNVNFTSDEKMYRLYVTKYTYGDTDIETYEFTDEFDTKNDGSLDLNSGEKSEFVYSIEFDAPTAIDETVQYNLWATTGRGDFRDISKRNAIAEDAYGSIVIKGSETASTEITTEIKEFTSIIRLDAPLEEGYYSESFISVYNGQTYNIVQQEDGDVVNGNFTEDQKLENAELAAYWDFGYYYTDAPYFSSASSYMTDFANASTGNPFVDITAFTGLTSADLNQFYFAENSTLDFDTVTAAEIDAISTPYLESTSALEPGDVLEFIDAYGNKGLIKITTIEPGFGANDYIEFDVKVQVNIENIAL